jgi:hypothetical protein
MISKGFLLVLFLLCIPGCSSPDQKSVRKWLQNNHEDPSSIEEIQWANGIFEPFGRNRSYAYERYYDFEKKPYTFLKLRHNQKGAPQVSQWYFFFDGNGEVTEVIRNSGSRDNHFDSDLPKP